MNVTESTCFLILDDEWRPLDRVGGDHDWMGRDWMGRDWRGIVDQILRLDSRWLIIEQQRIGEPSPSPRWEDILLSRAVSRRLRPMEMKLADHIIHGGRNRFSFRAAGLL